MSSQSVVRRCAGLGLAILASLGAASSSLGIDRKVLIVGVDGMRPDAMIAANAPNFDALIAGGAWTDVCMAEDITVSGPGWSSICTGVHRTKHGVTDNSFAGSNYAQYPHFFKRLEAACDISTVSIVHWSPVNTNILQGNADVIQTGLSDAGVAAATVAVLQSSSPDVIFLHFDDVDGAGHGSGFSPTSLPYLAAIERTDTYVGQIRAAIAARPTFANEDWLIIVTTDHGGTPDGTHGRNIPEHRLTPLIISGASTLRGTTIAGSPEMVDVPPTVFTFLGLPINPAWGWDGVARGLNMAASTSSPFPCSPPPPLPVGACCGRDGSCSQLVAADCTEVRGLWRGLATSCAPACPILTQVFSENFNGLPLGPNLDETTVGTNVWTATPPSGWVVDNSQLPAGGVREWRGWTFASPSWWSQAAGDQRRSQFAKGTGTIAVADPDEWFDIAPSAGSFNSTLRTRPISLSGIKPQSAKLYFDSSWLPEAPQEAVLSVSYDGGTPIQLFRWSGVAGPTFKSGATNETLIVNLQAPAGAQSMVLRFGLLNAGNNWWWAVDNLEVLAEPSQPRVVVLSENFEGVVLGPSVNEANAQPQVWSQTPPAGWSLDDTGVPTVGNAASGMKEWEGWAFTNKAWWIGIAGDQGRSQFTSGVGTIAVADPDEWDDRGSPAPSTLGAYNAFMSTPAIPLRAIKPASLNLSFDSSWRFEAAQRARLTASFDGAAPVTIFEWTSVAGPLFKPDATNERITLSINNPVGARNIKLSFGLLDARNNWWWAVDNLQLTAAASCPCDWNNDGAVSVQDIFTFLADWFNASGDFNADGQSSVQDIFSFLSCFFTASGC